MKIDKNGTVRVEMPVRDIWITTEADYTLISRENPKWPTSDWLLRLSRDEAVQVAEGIVELLNWSPDED